MSQLSILQYFNRDLECKYSERERMMGGSTRVKGTMWSPGGRWGPWWPLYSTSSSFSSQNKRGKSYKKDRTTLPWEMFSSFCLALYTMLASRVKTNILAINVTIKLLLREIFRFIFSLYMKKSDILAINVIIKLPKMGIWRLIFSQYMKKSNILALLITRLSLAFIFTFKIYIKTCDMFRLSALFSHCWVDHSNVVVEFRSEREIFKKLNYGCYTKFSTARSLHSFLFWLWGLAYTRPCCSGIRAPYLGGFLYS